MNDQEKSGSRTLFASMMLSLPGPLVMAASLVVGRSSTQLADFIRRTAELAAIIISWLIYRITRGQEGAYAHKKARLDRIARLCVGLSMCLGGLVMALIALLSPSGDKGNVIPGLVIAVLGMITNSIFWLRYRKLNQKSPDLILATQSKLYRAKSLVDTCVSLTLLCILLFPGSQAAFYMDIVGSVIVAAYLFISGVPLLFSKQ